MQQEWIDFIDYAYEQMDDNVDLKNLIYVDDVVKISVLRNKKGILTISITDVREPVTVEV